MLMEQMFKGEVGRKIMLREYFGKKSTNDFTSQELSIVEYLLLNNKEELIQFYDTYTRTYEDDGTRTRFYVPRIAQKGRGRYGERKNIRTFK